MAINNMNDGVGKKIVEALKMQSAEHSDGEVFVNDDPEITEQVERNIAGFNKYQKDTIKAIDGLNSKPGPYALETLEAEFSALGGLSLPENLWSAIRAKIEYIKDRMEEGLDATSERGSIDNTVQIAKDLKGRDLTEQELEDLQMQ